MAITIAELSKAIRASVDDPVEPILSDVTRLFNACTAIVERYAPTAPVAIKDLAIVQLAAYLYDAPSNQRRFTTSALRESGASSLLSSYRLHSLGAEESVYGILQSQIPQYVQILRNAVLYPGTSILGNQLQLATPSGLFQLELPSGGSGGGLTSSQLETLNDAVAIGGISIDARDLMFVSGGGTEKSIDIPGISVSLNGSLQGIADTIDHLNFVGVALARVGGQITVTVDPRGLNQGEVDSRIAARARVLTDKIARGDLDLNQQLPAPTANYFLRWNAAGTQLESVVQPAAGLSQAQVEGRINALARLLADKIGRGDLDLNQQLPAPSAGKFLKWNSGATALENTDEPTGGSGGGLTTAQVDARVAPFARTGALTDVGVEKVQDVFDAFNAGGWENVSDVGAQPATHPYVRETILQQQFTASNIVTGTYGQVYVGGPHFPTAYIGVRIPKAYLIPIERLALYIGSDTYNTDTLENNRYPLSGSATITHITSDATYNYYSVGPVNKPAGDHYRVQANRLFELDRSRIHPGDTLLPLGMDNQVLGHADGLPKWEDKPVIPLRHLTEFTETFPSFSLVRSDADKLDSAASYFSPTFDLDTAGNTHGEFHLSLELRIVPVSDVNMGFESGKANQTDADRRRALTSIVFASDLAEEADWAITTDDTRDNGIEAFSITVYSGPTIAGHYRLSVIHNANNEVGVWTWYEGEAGATGFTIYAELRASFTPSDAGTAASTPAPSTGETVEVVKDWSVSSNANWLNATQHTSLFADDVKYWVIEIRNISNNRWYTSNNVLRKPSASEALFGGVGFVASIAGQSNTFRIAYNRERGFDGQISSSFRVKFSIIK